MQDYKNNHQKNADKELQWFRIQKTSYDAVSLSSMASRPSGKRFDHQRRIPDKLLKQSKKILLSNIKNIQSSIGFDDLHNKIQSLVGDIKGIGPLYIYDTSLRIGAYLGFEPTEVYLHSGTLDGAKKLGVKNNRKVLQVGELPSEFNNLKPREIEDCLCIYKNRF